MFVGKKKRKINDLSSRKDFFHRKYCKNISNELQGTNWECIINLDTNKAYEHFTTIIKNCIEKYSPEKTIKNTSKAHNSRSMDDQWIDQIFQSYGSTI